MLGILVPLLKNYNPEIAPKASQSMSGATGSLQKLGHALFNEYLVPFEVTSVLILIAIIGVVVLAKQKAHK